MKSAGTWGMWTLIAVLSAACVISTCPSLSAEPSVESLDGLRQRGSFEAALEYLDRAEKDPATPQDFLAIISYERGLTLLQTLHTDSDPMSKANRLDEAEASFGRFIKEHADHELVLSARLQLGNALVERGWLLKTNRDLEGAREVFKQANDDFRQLQQSLRDELVKLAPPLPPADVAQRDRLRADYLQVRFSAAAILEEIAGTYEPGTMAATDTLRQARQEFGELYRNYRTRIAGLYARLYEARCCIKLGEHTAALDSLAELMDLPADHAAFRAVKLRAMLLAAESWLDPSQRKYRDAIERITPLVDSANAVESREAEWLRLRLSLACAHQRLADELKTSGGDDAEIAHAYRAARELADFVARQNSAVSDDARKLLGELPRDRQSQAEEKK